MAAGLPSGSAGPVTNRTSAGLFLLVSLLALASSFAAPVARGGERQVRLEDPKDLKVRADTGMTLDQAVDRFLKENLELRAMHDEVLMAQADVEAAGQPPQASLLIGVGASGIRTWSSQPRQLIPRRWVETLVAGASERVIEAQYQDAVRSRLDDLYRAFVDVQEAQMSVDSHGVALRGLESQLKMVQALQAAGQVPRADVAQIKAAREAAASALGEVEIALRKAKLVLANLLNLPDAEGEQLKTRLDLDEPIARASDAPPVEELIRSALGHRPDLRAHRLGLQRAQLDWLKALIEPLSQITVRPWPGRLDWAGPRPAGNAPAGSLSVVVTLPTTIRNRGLLRRAAINVAQTRTELVKVERQVILDVRRARLDYEQSRAAVDRSRNEIVPNARIARDDTFRRWRDGEVSLTDYLKAQEAYNERVLQHSDSLIRHRRNMLALNTAVGERIMP